MRWSIAALMVGALAGRASADPVVEVRLSAAVGAFEQITWAAPAVDLVGTHAFGRGFGMILLGYSQLDNHTFLSDGMFVHAAVAGGIELAPRVRAAAVVDVEYIAFHADADVLAEHPGVDLLPRRGGVTPTIGLEGSYRLAPSIAVGVFTRVALRELTVFDTAAGDRARARLVLAGAFLDLALR